MRRLYVLKPQVSVQVVTPVRGAIFATQRAVRDVTHIQLPTATVILEGVQHVTKARGDHKIVKTSVEQVATNSQHLSVCARLANARLVIKVNGDSFATVHVPQDVMHMVLLCVLVKMVYAHLATQALGVTFAIATVQEDAISMVLLFVLVPTVIVHLVIMVSMVVHNVICIVPKDVTQQFLAKGFATVVMVIASHASMQTWDLGAIVSKVIHPIVLMSTRRTLVRKLLVRKLIYYRSETKKDTHREMKVYDKS